MLFKIYPKYKSKQIGHSISYGESVFLYNVKFNAYVDFIDDEDDLEYFRMPLTSLLPQHNLSDPCYDIYRILLKMEASCHFTVLSFKTEENENRTISTYDYVTLKHSELKSLLTADIKYGLNNISREFAFIRNYTDDEVTEKFNLNSIWIIEPIDGDKKSRIINILDNLSDVKDVPVYILRHFTTGRVLSFVEINGNMCICLDPELINSKLYFVLIQKSKLMFNKSMYNIYCFDKNLSISVSTKPVINFLEGTWESYANEKNDYFKFLPLSDADTSVKKHDLKIDGNLQRQNLFEIELLDQKLRNKITFLKSAIVKLRQFYEKFKNKDSVRSGDILKAKEILKKIISFIFNTGNARSISYHDIKEDPIKAHQKLCKYF